MNFKGKNKVAILVLILILAVSILTACGTTGEPNVEEKKLDESNETNETTEMSEIVEPTKVVAEVNGTEITRGMVGEKLAEAEKKAVEEYVDEFLLNEFYKEIPVEEAEIEGQLAVIKAQVGEKEWDSYLEYINQPNEESVTSDLFDHSLFNRCGWASLSRNFRGNR